MKTAIVTGCSRGLGKSLKVHLESHGYTVLGATREQLDVTSSLSVNAFMLAVITQHKTLDLLINNAAILQDGTENILEVGLGKMFASFEMNAQGALNVARTFWQMLRVANGQLVNISSTDADCLDECRPAYSVSKAALEAITKKLIHVGRRDGVRVLSVRPCWFSSDMGGPRAPTTPDEAARDILTQIL